MVVHHTCILAVEVLGSLGLVALQGTAAAQVVVPILAELPHNPVGVEEHTLEEGNPAAEVHNLAVVDLYMCKIHSDKKMRCLANDHQYIHVRCYRGEEKYIHKVNYCVIAQ